MIVIVLKLNGQSVIKYETLTKENGLTDNRYNENIYTGKNNFTWISSTTGLYKFDGNTVTPISIETKKNGQNIQSNFFEDKNGNIWFSAYEALICFDPVLDSVYSFQINNVNFDYRVFHYDTETDNIWLRAGENIYTINTENTLEYHLVSKSKGEKFFTRKNDKGEVKSIIALPFSKDNVIEKIVISKNKTLQEFISIPIKYSAFHAIELDSVSWLLLQKNRISILNDKLNKITGTHHLPENGISTSGIKLNEETVMIGTKNLGLLHLNWKTGFFFKQERKIKNAEGQFLGDNINAINVTSNGLLWLTHWDKGLSYRQHEPVSFSQSFKKNKTYKLNITSIIGNKEWVVTSSSSGLIFYVKSSDFSIKEIKIPITSYIWSLNLISEKDVLVSSNDALFIFDLIEEKLHPVTNNSDATMFKRSFGIYGNRILVTSNKGIKELIKINNSFRLIDCKEFQDYNTLSFNQIFQSQHSLKTYVPYNATDLWVYQATPDSLRLITKLKTGLEFFGFTDSQKEAGTIWAGSAKGLVKITQDTVVTRLMDVDEKLKNVAVYSVIEDKKGVLWLGTNQGLFQYYPDTRKTYQYEEIDGLPSRTFSLLNSAIMTDEGEIWMGTNKGVVRFDPDEVKPYSTPPNVYIDGLLINDTEPVKGIGERDSLHLTYEENTLLFDVKAIGYYKAKRNKINYRLKGYESDWVSVKNGQMIRYAKLPPGTYTLQVQAEDVNGNQSQIRDLEIFVRPPFWQTWWFYLTLTLLALSVAFAFYRYRVGLIRKEEKQKTAVANLNLQVIETEMKALKAQMNPHFLFNSMNSIKGLILKQEARKASEYLTKFSVLLRGILSNSEKRYILLATELETLRLYIELEALRFTREIDYQIEYSSDIDVDFISVPPLVIQPFVENAIWHGLLPKKEGKNILQIKIERDGDFILYTIEDNGVGRSSTAQAKSLTAHKSMGIGITRKRIELIHPENAVQIIDLKNEAGQPIGTRVILRIYEPE